MAKVVPSGVIQLPDFAQLDYSLKQQKKREDLETAKYISQFQQLGGNILDADRELVQDLYGNVEDAFDLVAGNPTDPSSILKLNKAYNEYSRAHGTAMAVADHWRNINSLYNQDPTKYNLTSSQFSDISNEIRLNKRNSSEELNSYYSNLTELPIMRKRSFGSAEEWINPNIAGWDKTRTSLDINGDGRITEDQRDEWFNSAWQTGVLANEDSKRNAILSEAKRQNPEFLEREDLTNEEINSILANEDLNAKYLQDFRNRSKAIFDKNTSLDYVTPYQRSKDETTYALQLASARASERAKSLGEIEIYTTQDEVPKGMVALPKPIEFKGETVYGYGMDASGKKYIYSSKKDQLGQETLSVQEAPIDKFKSIEAMFNQEYKDPNLFNVKLAMARASVAKPTSVAPLAEAPEIKSAKQVDIENKENIKIVDQMVAARDMEGAKPYVSSLINKYPDAAKRSGIDPNSLTTQSINRFADEVNAEAQQNLQAAKAEEKAVKVAESTAVELEEYKDMTEVVSRVGRGLGIKRNPEETSDDYFNRIRQKVDEVRSDTYTYMGTIKSKSGNKDNIGFVFKLNRLGGDWNKAQGLYEDYTKAAKELEEIKR
jgi:hypothetical protein